MVISILGCGWLGLPLADTLIRRNYEIKGSTTTENKINELLSHSIDPFLINLSPEITKPSSVEHFWKADALVLNIPPGRKRDNVVDFHRRQIESVIEQVKKSPISQIVFISSTSVYPDQPGLVQENDTTPGQASRASGNALLQAEELLMSTDDFSTTVLRFGGLYGEDRHPVNYMAGRTNMDRGSAPINLIHRDDCIAIITQVIEKNITDEIYNAVSDGHPTRKEYYTEAATKLGLEPPSFKDETLDKGKNYKIVSNMKLKKQLGYSFIHPFPSAN